jgi:hypothetical protein
MTYDDLDEDLLEALRAVAGGCSFWIAEDPRLQKLHMIDENLLWYRETNDDSKPEYEVLLGSSGRAYLAGLEAASKRALRPST